MARQRMLLAEQHKQLLRNFKTNLEHIQRDEKTEDFPPVVKFFNPCGAATWLFTELSDDGDTLFGLADLGFGEVELGYSSLSELANLKLPYGLYIERDIHFKADKTLSEYTAKGREEGRIAA